MSVVKEILWFLKIIFTPGKDHLETEIQMVQLLAQRGEMSAIDFYDHFNKNFDYDKPKRGVYVSFGMIYTIMNDLEDHGVVQGRVIQDQERKRLYWRLTGRGPRKPVTLSRPSFQLVLGV